jgi:hypothetical protein
MEIGSYLVGREEQFWAVFVRDQGGKLRTRRDNSIRFRYLPRIMHCLCINLLLNFIIMMNLIVNVLNEVTLKFYCSVVN